MHNWDEILRLYDLTNHLNNQGYKFEEIDEVESRLNVDLPMKLKDYYLSLGKNNNINYSHNRLLKPKDEIGFSDDGYLVFYEENQSSVFWGIKKEDLKLDNPPVFGNYGTSESPDWHEEAKTTEHFLLLMSIYNGTFGGLRYNANCFELVKLEIVKAIRENWDKVEAISWERQEIYTDNFKEVLSLSFDDNNDCTALFIGTSSEERFNQLLEKLKIDWSYTSYEDEE
ncbi:MAG: SMI1/KNR4 family protein [Flavobacteriales bacterium]|nr:SMI1/KNR4 family protein [Flavobacteriales bacterium]